MVSCQDVTKSLSASKLPVAIDASVGGEYFSEVEQQIETILLWAHRTFGPDHLINAKEEFYQLMGKVFPDDDFFNRRMSYFVDYFIFNRPVPHHKDLTETPFQMYRAQNSLSEGDIQSATHSLFNVSRVSDQGLVIRDLIAGEKYRIARGAQSSFEGITKKDLFQGFLYDLGTTKLLSRGLIFHPPASHALIRKELKSELKKDSFAVEPLLSRFAKQQLRHLRHLHVNPKVFYSSNPR
jgi:hypothetical protein